MNRRSSSGLHHTIREGYETHDIEMNRVRPIRKQSFSSLYPPISFMPDIPLAKEVFDEYKRNCNITVEISPRVEDHNSWNDAINTSRRNYDDAPPMSSSSRIERQTSSHYEERSSPPTPSQRIERQTSYYEERSQQQMSYGQSSMSNNPIEDEHEHEESKYDRSTVEIAPGKYMDLRGSKETWDALERNFSQQINCACCSTQIRFIRDAAMVICPVCRMILPVDNEHGFGLGLGVKVEPERHCSYSMQEQYTSRDTEHHIASKDAKYSDSKNYSRDEYGYTSTIQRERVQIRKLSRTDYERKDEYSNRNGNCDNNIQRERVPIRRLSRNDKSRRSLSSSSHSTY